MEKPRPEDTRRKETAKEILRRIIEIYLNDDQSEQAELVTTVEELGLEDLRSALPEMEPRH